MARRAKKTENPLPPPREILSEEELEALLERRRILYEEMRLIQHRLQDGYRVWPKSGLLYYRNERGAIVMLSREQTDAVIRQAEDA